MSAPIDAAHLRAGESALVAKVETSVDYDETTRLANEAFDDPSAFDARHMQWLYERCFSEGSTIISLYVGPRKVGQFAMVRQTVMAHGGSAEQAVQLVDLFVLKPFRSRTALTALYGEVERQCREQDIRFAIGMPNASAIAVNEHFLGLQPHQWLSIHAGVSIMRPVSPSLVIDETFAASNIDLYRAWLAPYMPASSDVGIQWTTATFCERLNNPRFRYGLHAVENLLLVSSPRVRRGTPYVLLCGYFARQNSAVRQRDVHAVTRAACNTWRQPLFVYPGFNNALPAPPGWRLPQRIRPSTMLIQLRDFHPAKPSLQFNRYQPLDFDFA
jgi:hypothetical protein